MHWLADSFLPTGKVKVILLDKRADAKIKAALKVFDIQVLDSVAVTELHEAVQTHPDMTIFPLGGGQFVCPPEAFKYYSELLASFGAKVLMGNRSLLSTYPLDAAYNIARLGRFIIHRRGTTDDVVLHALEKKKTVFLPVRQGYSKCNTCAIAPNALITSDVAITKAALREQIDVLKIGAGHIALPGFPYGFIGGATGMISPELLVVTGNLAFHPDGEKIQKFCAKYHVNVLSLTDKPMVDIGSILPILED